MIGRAAAMAMLAGPLTACGGSPAAAPELDGAWQLETGHEDRAVPVVEESRITLTVDGEAIGGTAACNTASSATGSPPRSTETA